MSEHVWSLVPCLVLHGVAFPVTKVTTVTGQLHPPLIPHHARHRPLRHGPGRILRRELSECQEKPLGGPEQCRADHDDDASTASEGEHRSVPEVKQEMNSGYNLTFSVSQGQAENDERKEHRFRRVQQGL